GPKTASRSEMGFLRPANGTWICSPAAGAISRSKGGSIATKWKRRRGKGWRSVGRTRARGAAVKFLPFNEPFSCSISLYKVKAFRSEVMKEPNWEETIFADALALPPDERAVYLDR